MKMTIPQLYQLFLKHQHVVTDSRKIEPGALFFALKGEKFNGNHYAAEALKKGAAYAIIDEKEFFQNEKTILVENALLALQEMASFHRKKLNIPILAVTGSNGKTTTKELMAAVLSKKYRINFTEGNLNNHIGVPLTLLKITKNTEIGVVEMGANHVGEIARLCKLADPGYGLVTNIGRAHLEGFGSLEGVIKAKTELYHYLERNNGTVFFNRDNSILQPFTRDISRKVSYGTTNEADLSGDPVSAPPFLQVNIHFPEKTLSVKTQLTGNYNFENVMAAACIGHYFHVEPQAIKQAIENYLPANQRSQLVKKNGMKIILDAYNANPTSMQTSIESFCEYFPSPRYLILGDMLELGKDAMSEHAKILKIIKKHPFSEVFLVGPLFTEAAKAFPYKTFQETGLLCSFLEKYPLEKGAVLIKGSRKNQLERVLDSL